MLLGATGLSAVLTWALQAFVGRTLGPANFASFMTVWGLVFFLLAFLQGVQQEVVRVTSTAHAQGPPRRALRDEPAALTWWWRSLPLLLALASAAVVAFVVEEALPGASVPWLTAALVLTLPFLVAHQIFNGVLAGARLWGVYAASIVSEALTRVTIVVTVVTLGAGLVGQTWALVLGGLGWLSLVGFERVRSAFARVREMDVRDVAVNTSRTLVATGSSALLINAFPVLLQTSGGAAQTAEAGVVIAAVILTRAPLLMPLYALQGMTIATFTSRRSRMVPTVLAALAATAALTLLGSVAAAWLGPSLLVLVFGSAYQISGLLLAALIAGAGLTAALTVAGWAALSAGRLHLYAAAWLSAPITAVVVLNRDGAIDVRAATALVAAPVVGLGVLAVGSLYRRRSPTDHDMTWDHEPV